MVHPCSPRVQQDEYTYTHALDCVFLPRDLRLLPVRGDERGMDPEHLAQQLQAASAAAGAAGDEPGAVRRPKLLYTIPTGHNPTGAVMTTERKRRILEVMWRGVRVHTCTSLHSQLCWRPDHRRAFPL